MHMLFRLVLILTVLTIVVRCQGARGGGSRGGGSSSFRGGSYRSSRCYGSQCRATGIITGAVIGSVFGLVAIILLVVCCCRRYRSRRSETNATPFVNQNSEKSPLFEKGCFKNGIWSSRYYQYGTWHGPYQLTLSFNHGTSRVNGHGMDDIGAFTIDGTFSSDNHQMALTKNYKDGTGNPTENFGHTVTLQLSWNSKHDQFEGKWFVQIPKYHGQDKFELKFERDSTEFPTYNDG